MSTPCANCGTPITDGIERCPRCDALPPLPDDATRPERAADPTGPPPWAVPIRDAEIRTSTRRGSTDAPARRRTVALVGLGAVVFVATLVLGSAALRDDDRRPPVTEEASTTPAGPTTTGPRQTTQPTAPTTTTTPQGTSTDTDAEVTDTTTTTTTVTTTTSTTAATATGTGDVPSLSSSFERGWIAQLSSVPHRAGTDALEAAWRELGADANIVAARTDDWAGFQAGYWVLVHTGPFTSADEVRAHCDAVGRVERDECLARELVRRA